MCVRILGHDFHVRAFLALIFGFAWVNMGISIIFDNLKPNFNESLLLFFFPDTLSIRLMTSALWVLTGLISVAVSTLRLKPKYERIAWMALIVMPVERAVSFLVAFAFWLWPGPPEGLPDGLNDGLFWVGISAVIYILSSLTDRSVR